MAVDQVVKLAHFLEQDRKKMQHTSSVECAEDLSHAVDKIVALPGPAIEDVTSRAVVSEDVPEIPLGTYVVSVRGRSRFRRLRRVGDCPNKPGVHFLVFGCLGMSFPTADTSDVRCRLCFGSPLPEEHEEASATSSGSSSES